MQPVPVDGPEPRNKAPVPTGILILKKPSGPTSRDVVDRVARLIPIAKVGHAGTLDPLATGVLIVCVGAATRLTDVLQHMRKSYRTLIRLGARSDTLDADGLIKSEASPRVPSLTEVQQALIPLRGRVEQMPPDHSALKIKGRRAYDLARAGRPVDLAARIVQIDHIAVLEYAWPELELEIDCSKGTYIRSIARDVGEALGCGGYVQTLVRTRIGPFTVEEAIDPLLLTADSMGRLMRPAIDAVAHLPRIVLDAAQIEAVVHGRTLAAPEIQLPDPASPEINAGLVALVDSVGNLLALAELDSQQRTLQPRKVLI
jgi:tRNA pseudouridine55 synthase